MAGFFYPLSNKLYSQEVGTIVDVMDWHTLKIKVNDVVEEVLLLGVDITEDTHDLKELKKSTDIATLRKRAKNHLQDLVDDGFPVLVEIDENKRDSDGRLLAYVYLTKSSCVTRVYLDKDGFKGEMINENMVRNGYAFIRIVPPNEKYADTLLRADIYAKRNGKGMWHR
jgi:endonuclease YncB( thermonuclease family)